MNTLYNYRPHAFQLTGHDTPVLSPDRVSLELVPFDQSPSLHPFRDGWLSRLVKRLRGYYGSVRLPMFVHRQITSQGSVVPHAFGTSDMAFHFLLQCRHPGVVLRGSMAGLYIPLSTLPGWPHGQPPMTQGRYGSLRLYRMTLSFTTTCRFSPALSGGLNL
jgi:hypothetical protein